LTTSDRDVRELWTEYLTWITAEARRRPSDMTFDATTRRDHEMAGIGKFSAAKIAQGCCDPDGAACPITGSREGLRAAGSCAL
jgi:hypothetical protein